MNDQPAYADMQAYWQLTLAQLRANIEGRSIRVLFDGPAHISGAALGRAGERKPEHPTKRDLRILLDRAERYGFDVPDWLRSYVAARKVPRGRPPRATALEQKILRNLYPLWRIERRRGVYRRFAARFRRRKNATTDHLMWTDARGYKIRDPLAHAIHRVAARIHAGPSTLRELRADALRTGYRKVLAAAVVPVCYPPADADPPIPVSWMLLGAGPDLTRAESRPMFAQALAREWRGSIKS